MDIEADTHITTTPTAPKDEITFILPKEFMDLLVSKVTQSVLDKLTSNTKVDEYINDSISEWMNYEFDISKYIDTHELSDTIIRHLEDNLSAETTISFH